jgi:probable F420-dependent oxidoreductase
MTVPNADDRPLELSVTLTSFSADPPASWARLFDHARIFDAAGFDRLVVSDHVVFGERLDQYARPEVGGQRGGRQPTGPDGHWLEPLTTLAVLAGITTQIRLATGILLAALRRPVVLAKTAATLDVLSGGRLDLGVGVGWQKEEYDAAGLDFAVRGRLLDDTLEACTTLWRDTAARIELPDRVVDRIHMMPKPLQAGGVPIWVSGTVNPRVVARIARFGRRWIPWGNDAVDVATGIARMKDALAAVGVDADSLQVVAGLPVVKRADGTVDLDETMARVPELRAAGATDLRVRVVVPVDLDEAAAHLGSFVAAFRRAAERADRE